MTTPTNRRGSVIYSTFEIAPERGRFCPTEAQSTRKLNSSLTARQTSNCKKRVEARVGIEPTDKGFADLSLTTWVPRPITSQ
jgi:hypothetical protein